MGMGEPLGNYKAVIDSCHRINEDLNISARNITISTVGLVPKILELSKEKLPLKLAVSLHAIDNESRSKIMPINKRFPLEVLLDACKKY